MRLGLRIHSDAGVRNREQHVSSGLYDRMRGFVRAVEIFIRCFNKKFSAFGHRVARVHREIHDDLLDLTYVRANCSEVRRSMQNKFDIFANQARNQLAHFFDD